MASGDLEEFFYRFIPQNLGDYPCFDIAERDSAYDCTAVWEVCRWVEIGEDKMVYSCFCRFAMEGSWTFWAHYSVSAAVSHTSG